MINEAQRREAISVESGRPAARAVLVSGGLDSAILVGESLREGMVVHPLYVRSGFFWEEVELEYLRHFLQAVEHERLRPLALLDVPVGDLLAHHWSIQGQGVPDEESPDEAVYLPGRNVLLLGKAMLWCQLKSVPEVALAILRGNPFPDATAAFFTRFAGAVNEAIGGSIAIVRPYAGLGKRDVMVRGMDLPLGLTFSCIQPIHGRHCGRCNKCSERRRAFAAIGLADPTQYAG